MSIDAPMSALPYGDPQAAFEKALASGRLSHDPNAPNYVGDYMFMGPARDGRDAFKNRNTREYIA